MTRSERRAQERRRKRLRKHPALPPVPTAREFELMVQADPAGALRTFCAVRDLHREAS